MASSLVRAALRRGASLPLIKKISVPTLFPALKKVFYAPRNFSSAAGNERDAEILAKKGFLNRQDAVESLEDKEENWISHGYSIVDRDEDEFYHHMVMFMSISVVLSWLTFFLAYFPDYGDVAWIQREACLELERREKAGLPLIDRNLIDPARIDLPSEEELGDFDIII